MFKLLVILVLISVGFIQLINAGVVKRSEDVCQSDDQCSPGTCCFVGEYVNSYPYCRDRQKEGQSCRPNEELLTNSTHYYNGGKVELHGVHTAICNCMEGLTCAPEGVCKRLKH